MPDTPSPADRADLSNWRTPPFSRWAFRNVRAVLPVADVAVAAGTAPALPSRPRSLDGFSLPKGDGSSMDFAGFLDATVTDGIIVLHDGAVVVEAYADGMTPQTPHILMSATKSIIGLLAGILAHSGALDVDAPVTRYLPELAQTRFSGATLRHLLDMRGGVILDESEQHGYADAGGWDPVAADGPAPGLHGFIAGLTSGQAVHGGPFRYISVNTDLLGWIIERATGKSVAELASTLLWQPLGAEHPAAITLDRHGAPRCTGGFCATLRDFARVGQLVLDGGAGIVPAAWIDDIIGNGDPAAWRDGEWGQAFTPLGRDMRYRSGWYVVDEEPQHLFAMGIHGQNLFVDRANRLVIAKVSTHAIRIDFPAIVLTHRAVPEIRRCVLGG
jgi:hypothetical protein